MFVFLAGTGVSVAVEVAVWETADALEEELELAAVELGVSVVLDRGGRVVAPPPISEVVLSGLPEEVRRTEMVKADEAHPCSVMIVPPA
jgi:hypothetical protein